MTTAVLAIEVGDLHVHAQVRRRLHRLPHHVGVNRQLATATVHEHRERDARGPAEVREFIHRGANRAAGVEHVVDDHDLPVVEAQRKAGLSRRRGADRWSAGRRDTA